MGRGMLAVGTTRIARGIGAPLSACHTCTAPLPRRAVRMMPSPTASAHSEPPTLMERRFCPRSEKQRTLVKSDVPSRTGATAANGGDARIQPGPSLAASPCCAGSPVYTANATLPLCACVGVTAWFRGTAISKGCPGTGASCRPLMPPLKRPHISPSASTCAPSSDGQTTCWMDGACDRSNVPHGLRSSQKQPPSRWAMSCLSRRAVQAQRASVR